MASVPTDRVLETSTTTGTGTLTLGGAVTGYRSFAAVGNANTTPYAVFGVDANGIPTGEWETGIGTYTASGTTFARTTVQASSNANAAVNFSAGTKYVTSAPTAAWLVATFAPFSAKGADLASATTTDIGAATGDFVDITGTTTITGLGTIAAGIERTVRFTGILTLTHNATSLILPGEANITTAANDRAIFRSLGSGNWLCVSYSKASGTAVVAGGGGLTNWAESAGTYSSKDWKRFYPISGTNVNAVFSPLGTGSIQAQVADGTSTGGNQRGSNAVDWQTKRSDAQLIASGTQSVVGGGSYNKASGTASIVAGGYVGQATAQWSSVGGGAYGNATAKGATVPGGRGCTANGTYSIATGLFSTARSIHGVDAFASGRFVTSGDAQRRHFVVRGSSTSATPVVLTCDAGAASTTNQIILPNNSCYMIRGLSACLRTDVTGDRAEYEWSCGIYRGANAASTVLDYSNVDVRYEGDATFDFTLAADTTNGGLTISFVGASGKTVRAVTTAWCCEVTA